MENKTGNAVEHLTRPDIVFSRGGSLAVGGENGGGNSSNGGGSYFEGNLDTKNLMDLTITAWVKPDLGNGSSVMTVVSGENSFILGINNNMPPSQTAFFSTFDGIKWTTVRSTSLIHQQWTHLTASFNGSSIMIYVNGTLEGTSHVDEIPLLVSGRLTVQSAQNLTSDGNVTIGAYYEKARSQNRDLFSGEISDLGLYYKALAPEQIERIFHTTNPSYNATRFN